MSDKQFLYIAQYYAAQPYTDQHTSVLVHGAPIRLADMEPPPPFLGGMGTHALTLDRFKRETRGRVFTPIPLDQTLLVWVWRLRCDPDMEIEEFDPSDWLDDDDD